MPNTLLINQDSLDDSANGNSGAEKHGNWNVSFSSAAEWDKLPVLILRKILCFLNEPYEVVHACQTCRRWCSMLQEPFVWQHLYFCKTGKPYLNVLENRQLPSDINVYDEVVRLCYDTPKIDILVKDAHADEVLHVSFSHTGLYFCTTSKDCSFKVWFVNNPVLPIFSLQMGSQFKWKYTQYSEFNSDDTMLLVSGVNQGQNSNSGHIAVFNVPAFELLSRVRNQPYDVFGCWFGPDSLLSGMLRWGTDFNSTSIIYLNHATQSVESANQSVRGPLFRFENRNGSSLRMLRVINFRRPDCIDNNMCGCSCLSDETSSLSCGRYLAFTTGSQTFMPHEIAVKRIPDTLHDLPPVGSTNRDNNNDNNNDNYRLLHDFQGDLRGTDLTIDVRGHLVGVSVDPENSAIFMNVRKWPENTTIDDPFQPPLPSKNLEVRVVDLASGRLLKWPIYSGHRAHTGETDCFFIFLDVSEHFVASGAEDSACYLWDRHSAGLLRRIEFANVVNCAAFLPSPMTPNHSNGNGGLLVSVSDDRSLKLSFSERRFKSLPKKLRDLTVTQLPPDL